MRSERVQNDLGATAGLRYRNGQTRTSFTERVSGGGEPHPESPDPGFVPTQVAVSCAARSECEHNSGQVAGIASCYRRCSVNRREFLTYASGAAVSAALSRGGRTFAHGSVPISWRTFEVTTRVEVLKPSGSTRIWLPAALLAETPFQKTLANDFKAEEGAAKLVEGTADALG